MKYCSKCRKTKKFYSGLTIIELTIAMVAGLVLVFSAGMLLVSGNNAWVNTYNSANSRIKQDAQAATIAFGSIGRKSNRLAYKLYDVVSGTFTPAVPQTSDPEEVVFGDALEFRYWDVALGLDDSYDLLDVTKTATAYALFYIDDECLKVDYGPYPPGAVPEGGGQRNTSNISTIILAQNVNTDPNEGTFSHTTINGVGQGCVRMNLILTDPESKQTINVKSATFMRNIWPR